MGPEYVEARFPLAAKPFLVEGIPEKRDESRLKHNRPVNRHTPPRMNGASKRDILKGKFILQPSIFRGYVSF